MGLLSWFSETSRKSAATAAIQGYLEILKHNGLFEADPAKAANYIVATACDQSPSLVAGRFHPYVFAAGALAVFANAAKEYEMRSLYSTALAAMMEQALREGGQALSIDDSRILEQCEIVLRRFDEEPSPLL